MMLRAFPNTRSSCVRRTNRTRRVGCELLEDRQLLATWTVTGLGDTMDPGTLRWAVKQAAIHSGQNTVVVPVKTASLGE